MRYLRTNTATIVTVGPFFDKTDGVTLETALTITNERISFTVDANDGSAPTLVLDNVTGATSGTSNDLNYITNCDAGLMQIELSAANTNYLGRAFLTITDAANHCPVFHEFTILPAVIYDAMIAGTDLLDVSMTQILGTAVSTPATAGILDVNLKNIANAAVATTSAQLGVNLVNIAGSAVSTSTAQLGVNTVQAGGTAWGSGAITSGAFATGAITATAIAADAIGASELAADAATEIGTAVWATATRTLTANTNLNDPTAATIADAVWDEARSGHTGAGSFGEGVASVQGNVTGSVGSLATQAKADVNAEVVDVLRTDTLPDDYAAHEAQPTFAEAILAIHQFLMERSVSGTTVTVQKPDGTTTALTLTLDDGTNPTSVHRSA